jgi:hypothetical protein
MYLLEFFVQALAITIKTLMADFQTLVTIFRVLVTVFFIRILELFPSADDRLAATDHDCQNTASQFLGTGGVLVIIPVWW